MKFRLAFVTISSCIWLHVESCFCLPGACPEGPPCPADPNIKWEEFDDPNGLVICWAHIELNRTWDQAYEYCSNLAIYHPQYRGWKTFLASFLVKDYLIRYAAKWAHCSSTVCSEWPVDKNNWGLNGTRDLLEGTRGPWIGANDKKKVKMHNAH